MSLQYKDDWEEAQQRMRAYWAGEDLDRCGIQVYARRAGTEGLEGPPLPDDIEARWMDLDFLAAVNDYRHEVTFYGGEAFPTWHGGYPGIKSLDTFLGCPTHLAETTAWHDPILFGEDLDLSGLRIDEENRFYKFTMAMLARAAQESPGKCIPSMPAFGGSGDTLAALRGTERLALDVAERPEQVREADLFLMSLWEELYERFLGALGEAQEGTTAWLEMWSPGKFYPAQNDFSYMISPRSFREIFIPTLEAQTRFLDHSVYHTDGEGGFNHLDALCELPELDVVQLQPGAGKPTGIHYLELCQRVQAAGKGLQLYLWTREDVELALTQLSSRGLFLITWVETEAEAREILRLAEKLSRVR